MSTTNLRGASSFSPPPGSADLDWRRDARSITVLRDERPLASVSWAPAAPAEGLDIAVELGSARDPEVACALLDQVLLALGREGVPVVRLTLTPGEPQTPGLLQIARGQRPSASSAAVVAGAEAHAAGQSALVDVRLQPARRLTACSRAGSPLGQ